MEKEVIKITCYDITETWENRETAKDFYLNCMLNSEGSEQERYTNIYLQLCQGYTNCKDCE